MNHYLNNHDSFLKSLSKEPDWLLKKRKISLQKFSELGFPSRKTEEWRYLNLKPLQSLNFDLKAPSQEKESEKLKEAFLKNHQGPRFVFLNGKFSSEASDLKKIKGLRIQSFSEISEPQKIESLLHSESNAFSALNLAYLKEAYLIEIDDEIEIQDSLHFIHFNNQSDQKNFNNTRFIFKIGKNSKLSLIETFFSESEISYWNNQNSSFLCDENSSVTHYKIQNESQNAFHISETQIHQKEKSQFKSTSIALGAQTYRNTLHFKQEGEFCHSESQGLSLISGNQEADQHVLIDHLKAHGSSKTVYKSICDEKSKGIFDGKVVVHPHAQKTEAEQSCKYLLLSQDAEADPKPQLEIYADDVKCAHGATVGQLDETSLFYLRSRGIPEDHARKLLTFAFASEILSQIDHESFKKQVSKALSQDSHIDPEDTLQEKLNSQGGNL